MQWYQPFAALGSAAFQNGASVLCRHPRAESVLFGAAAIVWLISSLRHGRSPSNPLESENLKFRQNDRRCQSNKAAVARRSPMLTSVPQWYDQPMRPYDRLPRTTIQAIIHRHHCHHVRHQRCHHRSQLVSYVQPELIYATLVAGYETGMATSAARREATAVGRYLCDDEPEGGDRDEPDRA